MKPLPVWLTMENTLFQDSKALEPKLSILPDQKDSQMTINKNLLALDNINKFKWHLMEDIMFQISRILNVELFLMKWEKPFQ
jgi:hypothetical protein